MMRQINSGQLASKPKDEMVRPRVFVGQIEIAGMYGRIVECLRKSDYPISFREISPHAFAYNSRRHLSSYRYTKYLDVVAGENWTLLAAIKRRFFALHFLVWAVRRHDIFVFVFGKSFLRSNLDLILLRLLRKRVVSLINHGSEARPAILDGAHWSIALKKSDPLESLHKTFQKQKKHIKRIERYSNLVVAHPLTSQLLRKPAVASQYIGIPAPDIMPLDIVEKRTRFPYLHLVHAPSDRRAKGSDRIFEAVDALVTQGSALKFTELHGVSNDEVLKNLRTADIVIDQLYSDTRLAGLGTEAACLGVAVLTCSYGDEELAEVVLADYLPPALVVHPRNFENTLSKIINDDSLRNQIALETQRFVHSVWSVEEVANRFLQVVTGDFPDVWLFDPITVLYVHGSGLEESELIEIWKSGLTKFGEVFIDFPHRPDLMKKIFDLIDSHEEEDGLSNE